MIWGEEWLCGSPTLQTEELMLINANIKRTWLFLEIHCVSHPEMLKMIIQLLSAMLLKSCFAENFPSNLLMTEFSFTLASFMLF